MDPLEKTVDPRKTAERDGCAVAAGTLTERSRFGGAPDAHACAVGAFSEEDPALATPCVLPDLLRLRTQPVSTKTFGVGSFRPFSQSA